jgi:hypothetical protein
MTATGVQDCPRKSDRREQYDKITLNDGWLVVRLIFVDRGSFTIPVTECAAIWISIFYTIVVQEFKNRIRMKSAFQD